MAKYLLDATNMTEGGHTIVHHPPQWRLRVIVRGKDNLKDCV